MVGKRFPVLRVVGSKFEMLALLTSTETGAVGICGKRFRPKKYSKQINASFVEFPAMNVAAMRIEFDTHLY